MKLSFFSLLMITSYILYGQQTIELGQDVMGTFSSDSIECYELTIEESGEYILTYNLLDATITTTKLSKNYLRRLPLWKPTSPSVRRGSHLPALEKSLWETRPLSNCSPPNALPRPPKTRV